MIIIGILLNIVGLGKFCWLLFTLAINAVPFFRWHHRGGSIRFKQAKAHSAPLSLAWLRVVSHSWSGSTLSPLCAVPSSASPLGCYLRFPRQAPATIRSSASPTSVFPRNGGGVTFAAFGAITVGGAAWARVSILTEPTLRGCCTGPSSGADWGDGQGQVTPWVCCRSVGISADIRSSGLTATLRPSRTSIEPLELFGRLQPCGRWQPRCLLSIRRRWGRLSARQVS
jgi:hypothetical protein